MCQSFSTTFFSKINFNGKISIKVTGEKKKKSCQDFFYCAIMHVRFQEVWRNLTVNKITNYIQYFKAFFYFLRYMREIVPPTLISINLSGLPL